MSYELQQPPAGYPRLNYMLHVSGGRTSAYMLRRILDAHGGKLPDNARAVFANTGKEHEATLEFLFDLEANWQVPITWIEYHWRPAAKGGVKDRKHWFRVVDYDTASRNGEPFEAMIHAKRMLPNQHRRICTSELKVVPAQRLARTWGWKQQTTRDVIGIRADEPKRIRKALMEECRVLYPLADNGADEAEVLDYWAKSPFNLKIDSRWGNCDLCFMKGVRRLTELISEDPGRADWWERMENFRATVNREQGPQNLLRFRSTHSIRDMRNRKMLPLAPADDTGMSCFCGD